MFLAGTALKQLNSILKAKSDLQELCEGKEVTISMGLIKKSDGCGSWDVYATVALDDLCLNGAPLFYGQILLEPTFL